ncbi:hypothetical protein FRB94_006620 [Tulasnella sp. JGI-2019a]|nr:hypothetical protein FRB93_001914 [Tulasnella sp. JGI-2019a]KAG8998819.1 hypothetical protein FRB94_006620 [Tulasnella sp. JGI-2019a]KAG9030441.1 hypothetical protein FRB95_003947 [Tulasnella sp. JGI-2019a]
MTISSYLSAPLVVIVGATGAQGRSVIRALAESTIAYRMRGFTRDTSKPIAQDLVKQGVEMVAIDPNPTPENELRVKSAFEGATYAFAMTIPAMMTSKEREIAEGKMYVDAAKAANIKLFIWSGLESISALSGGKYTNAIHFDSKAAVTQYCKDIGVPSVTVKPAVYMSNYLGSYLSPRKQPDGSFATVGPVPPESEWFLIDTDRDFGLFVRKAIELRESGLEISAYGEATTHERIAKTLSEITGKTVTYIQVPQDQFMKAFIAAGRPEYMAKGVTEMFLSTQEFGWYGNKDVRPSIQGLERKPRTWEEFVKAKSAEFNKALV